MPLTCEDAVAEGEKALLLPAKLNDLLSGLGRGVEVHLQCCELLLLGFPDEIPLALYTLPELSQGNKLLLFHLHRDLNAVDVSEQVETQRHRVVFNMKKRLHREV